MKQTIEIALASEHSETALHIMEHKSKIDKDDIFLHRLTSENLVDDYSNYSSYSLRKYEYHNGTLLSLEFVVLDGEYNEKIKEWYNRMNKLLFILYGTRLGLYVTRKITYDNSTVSFR